MSLNAMEGIIVRLIWILQMFFLKYMFFCYVIAIIFWAYYQMASRSRNKQSMMKVGRGGSHCLSVGILKSS